MSDTILVRVPPGRVVDFHATDMPPGKTTLRLTSEDEPCEVPNTTGNRRKIRGGDLIEVEKGTVYVDHGATLADRVDAILEDVDTGPVKGK